MNVTCADNGVIGGRAENLPTAKSVDLCQPARTVQTNMSRNFLCQCINFSFHRTRLVYNVGQQFRHEQRPVTYSYIGFTNYRLGSCATNTSTNHVPYGIFLLHFEGLCLICIGLKCHFNSLDHIMAVNDATMFPELLTQALIRNSSKAAELP